MSRNHFIREWRKYRQLTQIELAERTGCSGGLVSFVERGLTNYTQPLLEALATALDCSPADLLARNPISEEEQSKRQSEWRLEQSFRTGYEQGLMPR